MKYIETDNLTGIPGHLLGPEETFSFQCHPGISCFNRCCRNLRLLLHPYDVIRLKQRLGISSGEFLQTYTEITLREGHPFPDVVLRMADDPEKSCIFLTQSGCRVYTDRPQTCRAFPVEQGLFYEAGASDARMVHFFRPPDFCRGPAEERRWTVKSWETGQGAAFYNQMAVQWAGLLRHFRPGSFDGADPEGQKGKMAFMAAYSMDQFRDFVLNSTFLKRYSVNADLRLKLKTDDVALLRLGMAWIGLFLLNLPSRTIRLKN